MSIAKSHVRYVFYMADYDIMSGARLYQTRSAEARMRMDNHLSCARAHDVMSGARLYQTRSAEARMRKDNHLSCAKAHDIMSGARLYQTRSAKARMCTLVYDKTQEKQK